MIIFKRYAIVVINKKATYINNVFSKLGFRPIHSQKLPENEILPYNTY